MSRGVFSLRSSPSFWHYSIPKSTLSNGLVIHWSYSHLSVLVWGVLDSIMREIESHWEECSLKIFFLFGPYLSLNTVWVIRFIKLCLLHSSLLRIQISEISEPIAQVEIFESLLCFIELNLMLELRFLSRQLFKILLKAFLLYV